jgi:predicted nucleotidyltransferase
MNLSEPLDGLTSVVEAAVLRVLARTDVGFSGRQVHGLASVGSTSSVHRALTGFVHLGLVSAEARPPSIIYRINRQHALWPAIELGLGARSTVIESIRGYCAEDFPEDLEVTVVLYGSVARRDSTRDSDIDLFAVYPDEVDEDSVIDFNYGLSHQIEQLTGNHAQIVSMSRTYFSERVDGGDPLVSNILADGILLHGRSLMPTKRARAA